MNWERIITIGRAVVETGAKLIGAAMDKDVKRVEEILGPRAKTTATIEDADAEARRIIEGLATRDQGT
jgi:hypothetical protein